MVTSSVVVVVVVSVVVDVTLVRSSQSSPTPFGLVVVPLSSEPGATAPGRVVVVDVDVVALVVVEYEF